MTPATLSRNVATVPNFTPAAGSFIIPNTPTVTSNFVLQGNTGGVWATISNTEYELFPFSGYIAQRVTDSSDGSEIDWSGYSSFRLSAYTKSVSGTRTGYTNQTVTFSENDTGYTPIGEVGELNGEALKNAVTNFLAAGGGTIIADETGITSYDGPIKVINQTAGAPVTGFVLSSTDASADDSVIGYYYDGLAGQVVVSAADSGSSYGFQFGSNGLASAKVFAVPSDGHFQTITSATSRAVSTNGEGRLYIRNQKLVCAYQSNSGTLRYFYIDLTSSTNQSWTYSATEP